jgi:hypothetical protein
MRRRDVAVWLFSVSSLAFVNLAHAQTASSAVTSLEAPQATSSSGTRVAPWEPLSSLNLSGSLRAGYWSSDRVLDNRHDFAPGSVWLKSAPIFGNGFYASAEGWVDREQPLNGNGHTNTHGEIREGYLGWRDSTLSVTVGRRIITWGRADRINPTDVISSRDYTRLFPDDDDERRGSAVITGSYALGDYTVTALWLPEFRPNIYPIPSAAGLTVRQGADRIAGDQYAARLERIGTGIDWSLSYFDGINRNPGARLTDFSLTSPGASQAVVEAVYNRVRVWGADIATNVGDYGFRGEIAYSQPTSSDGNLFNPHPFVQVVVGIDRNLGRANIDLQYVTQYILSYTNLSVRQDLSVASLATRAALVVNQKTQIQHGPTLRVGYTMLNDTLSLEMAAAAFVSDGSYFLRPRATYSLTDAAKLTAGANIFSGASDSFFGQLRHNNTFLSELRYSF